MLADGIATMLSGACCVFGVNTSSSSVGLIEATGVGSRVVAYAIGAIFVDKARVYAAGAALVVAAALFAFFRYSRTGTAIRACADNLVGAAVVGLNVRRLYALTFGIGLAWG